MSDVRIYQVRHPLLVSGERIAAGQAVLLDAVEVAGLVRAGYLAPLDALPPEGALALAGGVDRTTAIAAEEAAEERLIIAEALARPGVTHTPPHDPSAKAVPADAPANTAGAAKRPRVTRSKK